jgi:predicted MFS family arabinose efflux permease
LGTVFSIVEIIGALLYYKFSRRINVRKWLIGSVYLGATTTMCYLFYTPISAIVYGLLFCLVGMFIHLIVMDYTARIVPKGLETTAFALLCSIHNLSGTASSITGAWLLPIVGLKPLIIISSLTSFLCLAFIKYVKVEE